MLTITDAAWSRLSELSAAHPDVTEWRLIRRDGRVKCRRAVRRDNDHTFQQSDGPVLLMSPGLADRLAQRTLDAPATRRGRRLRLRRAANPAEFAGSENQSK